MKYKPLKTIFHMENEQKCNEAYQSRLNHYATITFEIAIHPIRDQKQLLDVKYPLFICMTKEILSKTDEIYRNALKIERLTHRLPNIALRSYVRKLLLNELQGTNEKENIKVSKKELAYILNNPQTIKQNKRFIGLVNQYKLLGDPDILIEQVEDFRKVYDALLSNDIEADNQPDGQYFRAKGIGVHDTSRGKWLHRNEYDEQAIHEFLEKLLNILCDKTLPDLVKIMATHYMFEYLHPFYDGNGRLERYLLAKLLHDNLDELSALTFSYTVNRNRKAYDKAFEATSEYYNKGDMTCFVLSMFDLLIKGQQRTLFELNQNLELLNKLYKALQKMGCEKEERQFFFVLLQDKIFGTQYSRLSLIDLADVLKISRPTLNKLIQKHENVLIKLQSRPAVYELDDAFIEHLSAQE